MTEREVAAMRERMKRYEDDLRQFNQQHLDRYHSLKATTDAVGLLVDHQRRSEAALEEHDERLGQMERICGNAKDRLDSHVERLKALESRDVGTKVEVMSVQLSELTRRVTYQTGVFVTLILSVLGGVIIFLITKGGQP